jgi:pimeloyl-ACP methyl ester carboxylesterase
VPRFQPVLTRDGAHIVTELRALLRSREQSPPYILFGHSRGGLYMQLFARQYPNEVAALVLVDSTHPEQLRGMDAPETWPAWVRVSLGLFTSDTAKRERAELDTTGQRALGLPVDPSVPVFVLSALRPMQASSALADAANRKRVDLARLYPGSVQIWVDSDHGIPLESPETVVPAIRSALKASRSQRRAVERVQPDFGRVHAALADSQNAFSVSTRKAGR